MKIIVLDGTPEEIKEVAHLFVDTAAIGPGQVADSAAPDAAVVDPVTAIRRMLKRIKIPNGQMAVYRTLAPGKLEYTEYVKRMGRTVEQIRGVHGALGRRINNTPEIHRAGLQGNIKAVLRWEEDGEGGYFSLTPHALEALKAEGIV